MAALFVVELTVKNPEKLKEYSAQTPAILQKYKGQLLVKGKPLQIHASGAPAAAYDTVVVFEFPSKEDALAWYHSPEYQALLPLRDAAMDSSFKLAA